MDFYWSTSAQQMFVREGDQGERETEQIYGKIAREVVLTGRNGSRG